MRACRRIGVIALFLLTATGLPGRASAEPEHIRIQFSAPPRCPDGTAFLGALRQRTGRFQLVSGAEQTRVFVVTIAHADSLVSGRLEIQGPGTEVSLRSVSGNTCDEVMAALALMTALAIDPSSLSSSAPAPSAPTASASSTAEHRDSNPSRMEPAHPEVLPSPLAVLAPPPSDMPVSARWKWSAGVHGGSLLRGRPGVKRSARDFALRPKLSADLRRSPLGGNGWPMTRMMLVAFTLGLVAFPASARLPDFSPLTKQATNKVGGAARDQAVKEVNAKLLDEGRKNQCSFKSDSDALVAGCDGKLKKLANALVEAKKRLGVAGVTSFKFEVSGHTDSSGKPEHNKELSGKRAAVIERELVARGIGKGDIVAVGMGSDRPLVTPDNTAAKKAKNRRYEIQLRF